MKKIFAIAFTAVLALLAISCQKENIPTESNDEPVQYTFNISVNDQLGFDNDDSTKGGPAKAYKTAWESGDRIFLFFKPASGSLLEDTYATLTYDGSDWNGSVSGSSSLGEEGTLSAVYVYNLGSSAVPVFSDSKWTVETGNAFYNCQAGVSYTVSGNNEISASLNLVAPADFVRFTIYGTDDKPLTCDKVEGWKDVAIGNDMIFYNDIYTGYIEGIENIGNSMYKDFYGRIVNGGTSLKGVSCNFWLEQNDKLYEYTATPESDARSFSMAMTTSGSKPWTEVIPATWGFAKAKKGESDVYVKWIQLWEDGPKFAEYNVGATGILAAGSTTITFADAANTGQDYIWGANWRTPTEEELDELLKAATSDGSDKIKCEFEYNKATDDVTSVLIYSGSGIYEANKLYLPVPSTTWNSGDSYTIGGQYWSSTTITDKRTGKTTGARLMSLTSDGSSWTSNWSTVNLDMTHLVRPVLNENSSL